MLTNEHANEHVKEHLDVNTGVVKFKFSPKSYLKEHIYDSISERYSKKSKKKIIKFVIPTYKDYDHLLDKNYSVAQLKGISRRYNQRVTGNKRQLTFNMYNYLKYSFFSIKIQKMTRGYCFRQFLKMHGPALLDRKCVNDQDFLTLTKLTEIPYYQFYSFKDKDNFVYGFDLCSIYNMLKDGEYTKNPYNRCELPTDILAHVLKIIKLSKDLPLNIKLEDDTNLSYKKKTELRAMNVFQKFDTMGFITDSKWLMDLPRSRCKRYLRELDDVWNYRAQITPDTKKRILSPNGHLFRGINLHNICATKTDLYIKNFILDTIESLVSRGVDDGARSLGSFYALGTLTIVSPMAATSLPWLYESFLTNQ